MTKLDPRFLRPSKKSTKLEVDSRFKSMFEDKDFIAPVKVDKYGRRIDAQKEKDILKKYYRLEEEEEEEEVKETVMKQGIDPGCQVSDAEQGTTDDEDGSSSEEETEEALMDELLSSHPLVVRDVPEGAATKRLAVVNLDWDQIGAEDIFILLHGFKPMTGSIVSVTIWPSNFGRERMAREALEGPPRELFEKAEDKGEPSSSEMSSSDDEDALGRREEDAEDYDVLALRKYQLERLRYFYAVVECDSVATAAHIYRHCDGSEFETSANFLDLRFIPDHLTFEYETDGTPKDVCKELPQRYRPKPEMVTSALQQSKVALTWDADDAERIRIVRRPANINEEEADLKAYLASDSSDDDEHGRAQQYRHLLLGGGDEAAKVYGRKGVTGSDQEDLKITFASALNAKNGEEHDDIHREMTFTDMRESGDEETSDDDDDDRQATSFSLVDKENASTDDKTPFQKYLERRNARKQARKTAAKEAALAREAEKKKGKRKGKKKTRLSPEEEEAQEKETARLALLLDRHEDEDDEDDDRRRKRGKKSKTEPTMAVDLHDPRFAAIYDQPSYALDPSHPAFKRTDNMNKIIKERQRRRIQGDRQ